MGTDYEQIESSQRQHNELIYNDIRLCSQHELHCVRIACEMNVSWEKCDNGKWACFEGLSIEKSKIVEYGDSPLLAIMNWAEKFGA